MCHLMGTFWLGIFSLGSGLVNCQKLKKFALLAPGGNNQGTCLSFARPDCPYQTLLSRSHGVPGVDDRRIISGIIYIKALPSCSIHYPRLKNFWRIAGMTLTGFVVLCTPRGLLPAFQADSTGRSPCPMIRSFTSSGTRKKSCLGGSKTDAEEPPAMTGAPKPSCPLFALLPLSSLLMSP